MNNKKGFTLIELLAVIVILAVIAIIAVPQVLDILKSSRKSTAVDSTEGLVRSTENFVYNVMLKNNGSFPKNEIIIECDEDACSLTSDSETILENYTHFSNLELKQSNIKSATIRITERGKTIKIENLKVNGFTCEYVNHKAACN